jgi:outer membrane protein assembly factor BamA
VRPATGRRVRTSAGARLLTLLFGLLGAATTAAQTPSPPAVERIGEVRVHGNHTTPDADVLGLAGLSVGTTIGVDTLQQADKRLRSSGRFSNVEVRKRFRSLTDPTDILVVILVDEVAGISEADLTPGGWKRVRSLGMWLPVLDYADGYGFTYGARVSFVDIIGPRSRVSVPLTWGGERRAAVEIDRTFDKGPVSRIAGAFSLSRRENPHYEIGDTRRTVQVRAERSFTSWLRAGGGIGVTNVSFGDIDQTHMTSGVNLVVDTRTDPAFPRNALHATVGYDHLDFRDSPSVNQRAADLRGFVGLVRSSVLALRMTVTQADTPLPPYEQALLGGASLLRGYRLGYRVGDNLAAFSAELRVPLTSPLNLGRLGVKTFVDYGTVYDHGAKLEDQAFDRGIGGGVFLTATVVRLGLDVAWPKQGGSPRWHFGLGVTF